MGKVHIHFSISIDGKSVVDSSVEYEKIKSPFNENDEKRLAIDVLNQLNQLETRNHIYAENWDE
ncbi:MULTISPECIES: hypothetical protein [Rodentibacter]|uniref:Uncharacterized protein n=2 Tax=Rodentibacter TaxID=1960084 RepID=A0A4V6RI99_9PAST|nr:MULTISPECIES: hypothetical protein [Rodentibacter]OOF57482.1 hypothetical protein BKK55_04270 [Rodentibacter genomosp. 2]THA11036.1 hypothetical protein D3M78_01195 [Rodentibacter pneumotropicus]